MMRLEFPEDSAPILNKIIVTSCDGVVWDDLSILATDKIEFTLHTPQGDFKYTIDNKARTITTESDTPFVA